MTTQRTTGSIPKAEITGKLKYATAKAKTAASVPVTEARRVLDRPGFTLAQGAIPKSVIVDTSATYAERVEALMEFGTDQPPSTLIVGICAECGGAMVHNLYHHPNGYLHRYECWEGLRDGGTCENFATPGKNSYGRILQAPLQFDVAEGVETVRAFVEGTAAVFLAAIVASGIYSVGDAIAKGTF